SVAVGELLVDDGPDRRNPVVAVAAREPAAWKRPSGEPGASVRAGRATVVAVDEVLRARRRIQFDEAAGEVELPLDHEAARLRLCPYVAEAADRVVGDRAALRSGLAAQKSDRVVVVRPGLAALDDRHEAIVGVVGLIRDVAARFGDARDA